ncbi:MULTISPECIES: SHOCT domain-containing protein [unclassified Kribbella]|uniref:SHOCT domain-containing protein n=2 Tax=Kribbella TaxID=182639 RepID=UPI003078468F
MMGGVTMGWMWVWPALSAAGLLILGYLAVRLVQSKRLSGPAGSDSAARRILDTRYARGEIDADEYQRRKGLLQ